MRTRRLILSCSVVVLVGAVVGGWWYVSERLIPNLQTVRAGYLYRSGQPRGIGLVVVRARGVRCLINLRKPGSDGTQAERAFAARNGIRFVNIPIGTSAKAMAESAERFREIVADQANRPVLVHCSRGKERAGVMAAIFRMEFDRWSNQKAVAEMYRNGLEPGGLPVAEGFVRAYQPSWAEDGGSDLARTSLVKAPDWRHVSDGKEREWQD